jgi:hypothetical protein
MIQKEIILSFITLTFIFFTSCKKEVVPEHIDFGYTYFPVNISHYIIYDADSIVYNDFTGTVDTFSFEVKHYFESEFIDNSGRTCQRIEIYKRNNDTLPWQIKHVWHSIRTEYTAEVVEENIRYIKLSFPVKKFKKWNGNAYNTEGEQIYKYISVDEPYANKYLYFDSTLTVLQKDDSTLINTDYAAEIYARNIGLVYKKYLHLEKKITGIIKKGLDYTLTAKEVYFNY